MSNGRDNRRYIPALAGTLRPMPTAGLKRLTGLKPLAGLEPMTGPVPAAAVPKPGKPRRPTAG